MHRPRVHPDLHSFPTRRSSDLSRLHANGVKKVVMLTGDNRRVAQAVAGEVGVDEVRAELLPEDKLTVVTQLQSEGRSEEHTSELQSRGHLVCRLLLEKKNTK